MHVHSHAHHPPACAIAEAAHLNRTLLLGDQFCMSHFHNPTGKSVWRPMTDVFNISLLQKHARIEFHSDPNSYIQSLTPGSSVVYLRNEIMTEVWGAYRMCNTWAALCGVGSRCGVAHTIVVIPTQRLEQLTDVEVLVRMHRPWEHDPLGVWGYRTWWDHCFVNEDLANRMRALKVCRGGACTCAGGGTILCMMLYVHVVPRTPWLLLAQSLPQYANYRKYTIPSTTISRVHLRRQTIPKT